ncbi:BirA family transcriptional regulator, biotin operon repressor / biotin-[acetyl-CoA-carboxylase] ligase [Anaerosphaera aminiphila DSM 21120]|uniref:Bifunctional ligase/repressor BirA n=1 Tax=Anaerosphaera aminiphila DSM 21120 TaxID=1120995 RepID=A0A1M5UPM7_9FIRM|nr:biotin--[acetyl-CoA-carboxylase] ligase [Anaerosphaera aminiphila]SHH64910.1 BirA family transcriptional regulator, biotin operon repressor / biotin-[acetyl-CoA-carboxylase] ligase [Anaerosphaera aminiphila DSM 21120]
MKTKDIILKKLEENRNIYISGEDLATELNLSRTAIWKGVNSLKEEGYIINSSTNKGYKLDEKNDKISTFGIAHNLIEPLKDIDIMYYDSIDSTNTEAKRLLYSKNLKNFTALVSDEQTEGRGRRGKDFSSPKGTGIYLSVVIFPEEDFNLSSFDLITVRAAVAIVNAIKNKTNKNPKIKWVNDIFLDGKKICGILSEADSDFESRQIKSIIIGMGLNFTTDVSSLSKNLKDIAGSLKPENLLRNEMIGEILNQLYNAFYKMSDFEILESYKEHSLLLGREVIFKIKDVNYEALAKDINEAGNLIVELKNGDTMTLSSGEVSVKGKM